MSLLHPIIGITGSNGKTSTKDFTAAVLSRKFNVSATRGNLNNHIGLPLTVLATTLFGDGLRDALDPRIRGR